MPPLSTYMTTAPHTVGKAQTLEVAKDMMRDHGIRHLPVLDGNQLVGILSDRDIALVGALQGVNEATVRVEEAMPQDVLVFAPSATLHDAVAQMAARKAGSAVVMDHHKVVGIFTSIDAMNALTTLLASRQS